MDAVRKALIACRLFAPSLTLRQCVRLAWLSLIARPAQRGQPGVRALAVASDDERADVIAGELGSGEFRQYMAALRRSPSSGWRQAADIGRRAGTIHA